MKACRIAVVGGGWVAQNIWIPLLKSEGADIRCVFEPSPEVSVSLSKSLPGVRVELNFVDLIFSDFDTVLICSPNLHHVQHALFGLSRGFHVILEKPACFSLDEAELLIEASVLNRRGLLITSASYYRSDVSRMCEEVRQGNVGDIHCINLSWRRQTGIPRLGSWFTKSSSAIVGSGGDLGWHLLDIALGILGYPKIYSGFGKPIVENSNPKSMVASWREDVSNEQIDELSVDTQFFGCLLTETGVVVNLSTAWASHRQGDETSVQIFGVASELTLLCTFGFSTNGSQEHYLKSSRFGLVEKLDFPAEEKIAPYRSFLQCALSKIEKMTSGENIESLSDYQKLRSLGSAFEVLYRKLENRDVRVEDSISTKPLLES